ncbi:hydantoin utilization protein C, putative [Entamoeba invadens IP1]|uniref:Hydantoin utilization protein C, putative n=2 Tax=Entamoeba invadens TaxID=33085 RepID=L7FK64_ENTIV|nr:hydantoin utilization protein C, putative [Entamoeba invadens IP1]ELP84812.1 hydantoin utilization protein C, putative [Entamoeba invadens IP1]BAN40318.1 hydantoin utilization protein C, putative [Entamoeba invadens]|eukprot:XP_004184158.1 hydantoin utilization protein C, putative [Entamoeba invadens IP1]
MAHQCSLERMTDKIATFSKFGDAGHGGITRYTMSEEDTLARKEFLRRMTAIGAQIEYDDVANIYATLPGTDSTAKRIVMGSHCDSVKNGGNYDGILGVMSAMEVLETVHANKISHKHPLTAMIWTNEEGSLYMPAMMCSGIVCYDNLPENIRSGFVEEDMMKSASVVDHTTTFGEMLAKSEFKGEKKNRLCPEKYLYMFETHIEQGPILENHKKQIGVVDCVLGMFNYAIKFFGQTVHAGTFPMNQRHDAFFAAAEALVYLHTEIDKLNIPGLVYTTGEVSCQPNVHTCVPKYFEFSIDVRHVDPKELEKVLVVVKSVAEKTWGNGCKCVVEKAWNRDTVYFNKKLVEYVKESADDAKVDYEFIHSGAGHDAQFCAYRIPTTMVFVRSRKGLSHCEEEYSTPEDCTAGASVMLGAVIKADKD